MDYFDVIENVMNRFVFLYVFLLAFGLFSCSGERYRKDKKNRMTRKAKIASEYLQNQAIELTQENIENREETEKEDLKRNQQKQEQLNEINNKSSKVKKPKKAKGTFKFY